MKSILIIFVFLIDPCSGGPGEFWYSPTKPPTPTAGVPWPLPQVLSVGTQNLTVDPDTLQMTTESKCQIVVEALDRYRGILLTEKGKPSLNDLKRNRGDRIKPQSTDGNLTELQVIVDQTTCERYPYLGMNEKYTLGVYENGTAVLRAPTVWGALRGLETFSQLAYLPGKQGESLKIRTALIDDWPRFAHRGMLLDTSRHFLSTNVIKKNLDVMAHTKYNVFHWHIVDDQSFPYQSDVYPDLSGKGAFSQRHTYTKQDIADIVEYARLRGIRVMPEFDSPGHTKSWGLGHPDLMTRCYAQGRYTEDYGVIDPSAKATYEFMLQLLAEVLQRFPDQYIHLGGDEVFFDCWESNMKVEELMKQLGLVAANVSKLEDYYIQKLLNLVEQARANVSYMVWQEVFDNGVKVKPDTVVHVWMGNTQAEIDTEIDKVTKQNLRTILSSCWYLNYIKYGDNWEPYYACDPQHFAGTEKQKSLVIGGETCMWGEWIDATNLLSTMWPRASVVAERLWSDASITDAVKAKPRLEEHRCRLIRRGYPASPINGPGYCSVEWQG
jgi:hexosaminidase